MRVLDRKVTQINAAATASFLFFILASGCFLIAVMLARLLWLPLWPIRILRAGIQLVWILFALGVHEGNPGCTAEAAYAAFLQPCCVAVMRRHDRCHVRE